LRACPTRRSSDLATPAAPPAAAFVAVAVLGMRLVLVVAFILGPGVGFSLLRLMVGIRRPMFVRLVMIVAVPPPSAPAAARAALAAFARGFRFAFDFLLLDLRLVLHRRRHLARGDGAVAG